MTCTCHCDCECARNLNKLAALEKQNKKLFDGIYLTSIVTNLRYLNELKDKELDRYRKEIRAIGKSSDGPLKTWAENLLKGEKYL